VSRAGRCKVAEDGHFQLGRLLARRSGLSVGFPAPFRTSHRWLTTVRPELEIGEHRTGFVLELPPLAALEGLVLDARTRRPIVGAMVEEAFTDFEGRYFLPVSKKDRTKIDTRLDVVANGYLPLRTIHSAAKPIQLRPAREILVLVVDRADHPLPGTVVRVPGAEILKKGISGVTDIEGRCRVRAPAGESVVVRCLAPRHDLQEAPCAANQAELRVVIEPPDAHYTVIVRDEKGDPLSTAWIEDNLGRTHADAAGRIVMTSSRDAVLSAPGRERILLEPRSDWRNVTLDHRLREAGPIQVRFVYSDGRGVPMAWVSHFQGSGWTNADGWASIAGYARGETVVLRCDIEGWKEATYRVVAGEAPRTIRIPGRGEIIVRYAPEEADGGQPVAACFEPGLKGDDLPCYERWSRGELHLSLEEIEAWLFVQISPGGWRFYRDLRVREGERIELDYDFPRPGRIQGRVFGPHGDALEHADVNLFEFDSHEGTTDSEGKFTLQLDPDDLENAVGMIRLLVTHDEFAPVLTEPIDLGRDQDLVVHLTRGGTLEGRVVGADGAVELTILTPGAVEDPVLGSREDGSFNFDLPIRAGHHRVRIETRSGEKYFRDAEIEDGAQTKVSFHLP